MNMYVELPAYAAMQRQTKNLKKTLAWYVKDHNALQTENKKLESELEAYRKGVAELTAHLDSKLQI